MRLRTTDWMRVRGLVALGGLLLACLAPTARGDAIDDVTLADHITIRVLNYDFRDVRAPFHESVDVPNNMVRELDVRKPPGMLFLELDPALLGRSDVNFTIQARGTRQVDAATRRPYIHWDFRRRLPPGSGVTDSMGVFHAVNDADGSLDTFVDPVPAPVEAYDGAALRTYRAHLSLRDQGSDGEGVRNRASFGTLGIMAHMLVRAVEADAATTRPEPATRMISLRISPPEVRVSYTEGATAQGIITLNHPVRRGTYSVGIGTGQSRFTLPADETFNFAPGGPIEQSFTIRVAPGPSINGDVLAGAFNSLLRAQLRVRNINDPQPVEDLFRASVAGQARIEDWRPDPPPFQAGLPALQRVYGQVGDDPRGLSFPAAPFTGDGPQSLLPTPARPTYPGASAFVPPQDRSAFRPIINLPARPASGNVPAGQWPALPGRGAMPRRTDSGSAALDGSKIDPKAASAYPVPQLPIPRASVTGGSKPLGNPALGQTDLGTIGSKAAASYPVPQPPFPHDAARRRAQREQQPRSQRIPNWP